MTQKHNTQCPICGQNVNGSAVRSIFFCRKHRRLASEVNKDLLANDDKQGKIIGDSFIRLITGVLQARPELDL